MFPRLPGQQDDDIFAGAATTVRSAFPNSRLDSLTNHNYQSHQLPPQPPSLPPTHHNHQSHHNYPSAGAGAGPPPPQPPAFPTLQPAFAGHGNQLLSPYDPTIATDFFATATMNDAGADAMATGGGSSSSGSSLLPANDDDWWLNAIEEDTFDSPLAFDASENGLWNGRFVPPPPRPPFLDESVAADGLTTCDLCTWAWQRNAYSLDGSIEYKIDKTHLLKIESEEINVLIPEDHLATRIDFKHALSLWKQSTEVVVTCSECSDSSSSLICDSPNRSVQNLQQILMQSVIGKEVLSYFKSNKKLLDHHKNTIVELIVTYFLNKGIRLTCSEIEKLADDIVATFPTEEKDYYFSPRNGKSNPKGKLYDKYKNINKKFRKYGLIAATNIKTAIFQKNSIDENISDTLLEDNLYEEKQWLKYNRDDWDQIITKWATTTRLRRHDVLNIKLTKEICENWPLLKDKRSSMLIEIDFQHLFPQKNNNLIIGWEKTKPKLKALFNQSVSDVGSIALLNHLNNGTDSNASGEIGWAFTLIVVSILSALIGAIVMVVVLRCRRIKSTNANGRPQPWWCRNNRSGSGTNGRGSLSAKHSADSIRRPTSNSGVWTWLGGSRRSSEGPDQIGPPSSSPAENHYTHMDDAYSPVGVSEALYAELDRESVRSNNPSYQNTGYSQCGDKYSFHQQDHDIPMVVSSAPSSAYYSDLSVTAVPGGNSSNERAYEIVGLTVMNQPLPNWDSGGSTAAAAASAQYLGPGGASGEGNMASQRRIPRLAAINETSTSTTTVPSDYV